MNEVDELLSRAGERFRAQITESAVVTMPGVRSCAAVGQHPLRWLLGSPRSLPGGLSCPRSSLIRMLLRAQGLPRRHPRIRLPRRRRQPPARVR